MGRSTCLSNRVEGGAGESGENAKAPGPKARRFLGLSLGGKRSAVDRGADGLELRRSRLAEERHGDDAHHGDEGDEEGVLHEGGAALVLTEAGTEVGGEEFVAGQHGDRFSCCWVFHPTLGCLLP